MDSAEVIVGVEDGVGGLAVCDRAVRRRTAVDTAEMAALSRGSGSTEVRRTKRELRRS